MTIVLICLAVLTVCLIEWNKRRRTTQQPAQLKPSKVTRPVPAAPPSSSRPRAVIDPEKDDVYPYPYVYIQKDGSARELHPSEREYLETPFHFGDGARPYVKSTYEERNGWSDVNGFLERARVPKQIQIQHAPIEEPSKGNSKEDLAQFMRERGFEVTEEENRLIAKRPTADTKTD